MNYIDKVREILDNKLHMYGTEYAGLIDVYALLVFTVGKDCTNENIHDAWSIWKDNFDPDHKSLIPFGELTKKVQDLDTKYRDAVIKTSIKVNL